MLRHVHACYSGVFRDGHHVRPVRAPVSHVAGER
jgi:hypothetical protein